MTKDEVERRCAEYSRGKLSAVEMEALALHILQSKGFYWSQVARKFIAFYVFYDLGFMARGKRVLMSRMGFARSESAAENFIWDLFLRLCEKSNEFDPNKSPKPGNEIEKFQAWLFSKLRHEVKHPPRPDPVEKGGENELPTWFPSPEPGPAQILFGSELLEAIEACFEGLPLREREAVWCRDAEQLTYEEMVMRSLNMPPAQFFVWKESNESEYQRLYRNMRVRVMRGRSRLGSCLLARGIESP